VAERSWEEGGMVFLGMVFFGMVFFGMVFFGMVFFGMVFLEWYCYQRFWDGIAMKDFCNIRV
jgi:hypothetical protein